MKLNSINQKLSQEHCFQLQLLLSVWLCEMKKKNSEQLNNSIENVYITIHQYTFVVCLHSVSHCCSIQFKANKRGILKENRTHIEVTHIPRRTYTHAYQRDKQTKRQSRNKNEPRIRSNEKKQHNLSREKCGERT